MNNPDNGQHFATRTRVEKKSLTFFREAGRGKALVHLNNLVKFNPGLILLVGEVGSGRSRVLKQFIDSLKGKPGKVCLINRAIKNENQLYNALSDGFDIGLVPGDSLKSMQQATYSFLEENVVQHKPLIVALDDVQLCSLAMLEALLQLQAKFKQLSLILVGDTTLEKMIQRLQVNKVASQVVLLSPLDAREVRQYFNWRLPFQLSDVELGNLANVTQGNLALLEQEAQKKESQHEQQLLKPESKSFVSLSVRRLRYAILLVILLGGIGAGVMFYQDEFVDVVGGSIKPMASELVALVPGLQGLLAQFNMMNIDSADKLPSQLPIRSNEEWLDRQLSILNQIDSPASLDQQG